MSDERVDAYNIFERTWYIRTGKGGLVGSYVCGIGDVGNENVGIGWVVKEVDGVSSFIVRKPFLETGKVFFGRRRPVKRSIWFEGF
jgi:hypothetical protein